MKKPNKSLHNNWYVDALKLYSIKHLSGSEQQRLGKAIVTIALNDDPGSSDALNIGVVKELISVGVVAETFDLKDKKVAEYVVKYRRGI